MTTQRTLKHLCQSASATSRVHVRGKAIVAPSAELVMDDSVSEHPCSFLRAKAKQEDNTAEQHEALNAKPFMEIPGPRGLPVIGNALKYTKLGKGNG
jgi:hypothetical protein